MRNTTWIAILVCGVGAAFIGGLYVRQLADGSVRHAAERPREAPSHAAVGRDELISTLATQDFDRTISVMNRIKAMRYQGDILPLISEAWQLNLTNMPHVEREFVAHPRIRIEIADVLLQASRNGATGLEPSAYSSYARLNATSTDRDVAIHALLVLGVAGDAVDIPLLADILASENEATFRAAVHAFVQVCGVDDERVARIASRLRSRVLQDHLRQSWREAPELRSHLCK